MGDLARKLLAGYGSEQEDEEAPAPKLSQRLLAGYEPEAEQPTAAPAPPQGDELEQSILSAVLETVGDFAGSTGFNSEAQPKWAKPIEDASEAAVGTWSPGGAVAKGGKGLWNALKGMGKSAATEGALGVGQGALDRLKEPGGEGIDEMVMSLLGEGGMAAGADAALGLAGKTAGKLGDAASWLSRKADNVKAGGDYAQRKALIEKFGIEGGPDMLGELLRQYSPSGLFTPKTSAGHLANVERQLADEGMHHSDMVRAAGSEGADAALPKVWGEAQDEVVDRAAAAQQTGLSKKNAGAGRELEALGYRMGGLDEPQQLEQLIGYKAQLGEEAFTPNLAHSIDDTAAAKASGEGWKALRGAQSRAVSEASPYTEFGLNDSDKVFSDLSALQGSLTPRASADDAVGNVGTAAVSALAGQALNPMGAMSALASGTNNALRQATGGVAHDMFSNLMRPTGSALRGAGSFAEGVPTGTLTAEGTEQSRGHQTSSGIRSALQSNPQAFGQYAQQLQEAEEQGELSTTVGALIEDDPQFRALVKRMQGGR